MKLNALVIGNCQTAGIVYFLNKSTEFKKIYSIKEYLNWQMIKNKDSEIKV